MQAVKNILKQCYGDKAAVTDELVEAILKPGLLVREHCCIGNTKYPNKFC